MTKEKVDKKTEEVIPDFNKSMPVQYRSITEIIKDLSKPIPQRFLEVKQKGGRDIFFISWHNATKLLDYYAPGWQFEVKEIQNVAGQIVYTVRIGITCLEGTIWREATGNEEEEKEQFGGAFVASESQALRRAAAKFGLGRDLYPTKHISNAQYKTLYPNQTSEQKQPEPATPANPPSAKDGEKNRKGAAQTEDKPADGEAISEEQLKTLIALCENPPKRKESCDKNKVAKHYSNNRTEMLEDLTAVEALQAIDAIRVLDK